jgi:ATP-dependent DNA helicase RecQ
MMEALTPHLQAATTSSPSLHLLPNSTTYIPPDLLSALLRIKKYPFRSDAQGSAAKAVHSRREDLLCVLPTGGGKSLIYQATAATGKDAIILVVPFRALANDQVKAATKLGISAEIYKSRMTGENCPNILCVVAEKAITSTFQSFLRELESRRRIKAIVLDEAHLYLSLDLIKFRQVFADLPGVFRKFDAPLVFLTGSLPPSDELRLLKIFNRRSIRTIREPCRRKNISYRIDNTRLDWRNPDSVGTYIGDKALTTSTKGGRVLVFLPTKELIRSIINQPSRAGWLSVTAAMTSEEQAAAIDSWGKDRSKMILLATSVIGTGVDLPAVRMVMHIGLPQSLRDYYQQTGRAGRDGKPAVALLNTTHPPFTVQLQDEDAVDQRTVQKFAEDDECRRLTLDGHMDGTASVCLSGDMVPCDICINMISQCQEEAGYENGRVISHKAADSDHLW